MIRNFKNFYEDAYVKDLTQIPFKVAYIFKDPDDIYWALSKRFTNVLEQHAPLILRTMERAKPQLPFMTFALKS